MGFSRDKLLPYLLSYYFFTYKYICNKESKLANATDALHAIVKY
jgi:hypothetical protein